MNRSIEDLEERLIGQIREIQERHYKELEPLFYHLSQIRACRAPAPVVIDTSQWTEEQIAQILGRFKGNGALPRED